MSNCRILDLPNDCLLTVFHFMKDIQTWICMGRTCFQFYKFVPMIIQCGRHILFQKKIEVWTYGETEQYADILLNDCQIIRMFFIYGFDKHFKKHLYLDSCNLTCLTINRHIQCLNSFISENDIIFVKSGSFLKFMKKHAKKEKEYVLGEVRKFLCI